MSKYKWFDSSERARVRFAYVKYHGKSYSFTQDELDMLEDLLNEDICSSLDSGYGLDSDMVVTARGLLKKLDLKEWHNYNTWEKEDIDD